MSRVSVAVSNQRTITADSEKQLRTTPVIGLGVAE
jgi:hypothetical protein